MCVCDKGKEELRWINNSCVTLLTKTKKAIQHKNSPQEKTNTTALPKQITITDVQTLFLYIYILTKNP